MSRLRPMALATLAMLTLCLGTAAAGASAAPKTLSPTVDCQKHGGRLTQTYTAAELNHALSTLQPSIREYTTCYAAIKDALTAAEGGRLLTNEPNASGSGGGSGTVILIVVIVVVILLGGGVAFWAYRRNRGRSGDEDPGEDPDNPS